MRTVKFTFPDMATCETALGKSIDEGGNTIWASWIKCKPVFLPNIVAPAVYDGDTMVSPAVMGDEVLVDVIVAADHTFADGVAQYEVHPTTPNHIFFNRTTTN